MSDRGKNVVAPPTRLDRLAREERRARALRATVTSPVTDRDQRCELCSAPLHEAHRHLVDVAARKLVCACRACATLFPGNSAGRRQFRLVPDRVRQPRDFVLDDVAWAEFAIPVGVAFFFFDTAAAREVALYPSALGVTEAQLALGAWARLVQRNPVLARLEPDVEALLVNRARGAREQWLVPIDLCYRLSGLIRTYWKGLSGGDDVWKQLDAFFAELRQRSRLDAGAMATKSDVPITESSSWLTDIRET